ncbi:hypothetical protein GPAL_1993 [Glaciecola pallidula DSM 14239 = ACAM 615]|uniref:Uncharacterized protein n=1 Tax=Brumicola pallidula DSM 14239 = ACAM 615 TaxID=1121922 RepID=K6Y7Y1_9ALTE|nr:hypothetical protein GPAL_1993 [Glaciecola pallidula DSM 14239 = ACAM 615]
MHQNNTLSAVCTRLIHFGIFLVQLDGLAQRVHQWQASVYKDFYFIAIWHEYRL